MNQMTRVKLKTWLRAASLLVGWVNMRAPTFRSVERDCEGVCGVRGAMAIPHTMRVLIILVEVVLWYGIGIVDLSVFHLDSLKFPILVNVEH